MRTVLPLFLASAACLGMHAAPASYDIEGQSMLMSYNEDDEVVLRPDHFEMPQGSVLEVGAPGVLANDQIPEAADAQVLLLDAPSQGHVELNFDGSFFYWPEADFVGSDTFTYTLANGDGIGKVSIDVFAQGGAPVTSPLTIKLLEDSVWDDPAVSVLDQAYSPADLALEAMLHDAPLHGTVELQSDGRFVYAPKQDFNGKDRFTYLAVDSYGEATLGVVYILVHPVNDLPSFTAGPDLLLPAGTQDVTIPGWASEISAGPANEAHQDLWFEITILEDDASLLAMLPVLELDGNLVLSLNPGVSGVILLEIVLIDYDPRTNEAGTSAPHVLRIEVASGYQAPSFDCADVIEVIAIAGEEYQMDFAHIISGGSDVSLDELEFAVVDNSNPDMFMAGPSIDVGTGMIHFVLTEDGYSEASVTIVLQSVDGTHISQFRTFNILALNAEEYGISSVASRDGSDAPRTQGEASCASNAGGKSWLFVLSILVILSGLCVHRRSAA